MKIKMYINMATINNTNLQNKFNKVKKYMWWFSLHILYVNLFELGSFSREENWSKLQNS